MLFSDVVMPGGMNGVELAKHAVSQRASLKVLLTSGFAGESLDEWLSQGAWPFLRKPFLSTELAQALANLEPGAARRFARRGAAPARAADAFPDKSHKSKDFWTVRPARAASVGQDAPHARW